MRSRRSLLSGAALADAVVALGATSLFSTAAQAATPPGLHVSGTQLVEKDGTPFVARGVSHAHTWYTSQTATAIPAIRAAGANALRVVLSDGTRWTKNDAADVATIISLCKANKLICMLEDHDTTGYGEEGAAASLDTAASYWISLASVLKGQEDYVQINIGNEPFGNNDAANTKWAGDTAAAIKKLRAAGLHHNIVVDAPAWGQDWKNIMRDSAATVAAADPDANTLFSIHMYGVYTTASSITTYLDAFKAAGLPLIIGEFGYRSSSADVDDATVMAEAVKRNIGYYGWSWSGNTDPVLDMVVGFNPANLSPWGQKVLNGVNGIRSTAVTAKIYGGVQPTTPAPTTPAPTTPAPTTPAIPQGVLGIGDSVMLGARGALQQAIPGMSVDAVVSRQFANAIPALASYRDQGLLPSTVVVHLGTNGRFGDPEFDTMMQTIGDGRQVYFLTSRVPRSWQADVNAHLAAGVARHTNAHLIDWGTFSNCHGDWFAKDGFHVNAVGAANYAHLVAAQISGQAAGLQYC
jgi:mannan endo-1,4-beta-mannosidase